MRDFPSDTETAGAGEGSGLPRCCPECGAVLLHTNGCLLCGRCGYSPCD